ncbi:MAG TPA: PilZ domain-containing protein, partial [Myxococcota bacterium]|nr:PilZ domain-containing protein [Myxococcota bacterium]
MASEQPHALVLDDGELADVRDALASIGVRWSDAPTDSSGREVPLLVTTAARARALGEQGPAPRHHLHLVVTDPKDGPLVGVPCDFAVQRPVAASVLRLLAERAGYEGPERRRNMRVAIGAPVEIQCGELTREAILAQVSASGCGLVANAPFETGARLAIRVPPDLTAPRRLTLAGRVLGARRTTTADGDTWDVSVSFDPLLLGDRVTLRALMAGQPVDFRPRGDAGLDEAGPTGRPPRRR